VELECPHQARIEALKPITIKVDLITVIQGILLCQNFTQYDNKSGDKVVILVIDGWTEYDFIKAGRFHLFVVS
jgi:hypothetical protein